MMKVKVSGVGTSKQIRRQIESLVPDNFVVSGKLSLPKFNIKLSGFDAADLLTPFKNSIEEGIREGNQIVAEKLGEALDSAMMSEVWNWPTGGPRDIIDTKKLMNSRQIIVEGNRILISYNSPYFGIVHFGGYIRPYGNQFAEKVYVPGRPWVDSTIYGGGPVPQVDLESIYIEAIEKAFA